MNDTFHANCSCVKGDNSTLHTDLFYLYKLFQLKYSNLALILVKCFWNLHFFLTTLYKMTSIFNVQISKLAFIWVKYSYINDYIWNLYLDWHEKFTIYNTRMIHLGHIKFSKHMHLEAGPFQTGKQKLIY